MKMAQFPLDSAHKYPSELSGGMIKRAALARAIVMDPELLFLDEPTSGLDPVSAASLDSLVLNLQKSLGLTIVLVTHDPDTLWTAVDRVAFLGDKRVLAVKPIAELIKDPHPLIQEYFASARTERKEEHGN
jgi:phospholipid/cholesterol/gamma-HCH transport system ATP-binding protein